MKKIFKKKYEAQALAITMMILVVSSLIAMSIYSRSTRDRVLTLEERASSEALEVSDIILDSLTGYSVAEVIAGIEQSQETEFNPEVGIVLEDDGNLKTQISSLFQTLGILSPGNRVTDLVAPICPLDNTGNLYQLTLKEAEPGVFYEIRPGFVWSLPTRKISYAPSGENCALNMAFEERGDSTAGFVVTKIYCLHDTDDSVLSCLDYEEEHEEHIESYCFSNDGSTCNNDDFLDGDNWTPINLSDNNEVSIYLGSSSAPGAPLEYPTEIRVKAVGGTIAIAHTVSSGCLASFRTYQLRATANCSGVYRGKEVLLPEEKWYNTLFDYVIFNAEGSL